MLNKYNALKLVYIEWQDHYSPNESGWVGDNEEISLPIKPCINASVGWVITEDAQHIRLASQIADIHDDSDDLYDGVVTIIKSCITKKKVLSGHSPKRSR